MNVDPRELMSKDHPVSNNAQTAYLFQCGGEELFAVSPDKAGANIPRISCTQRWLLRQEVQFGDEDWVRSAITAKGYYIWRDPCWAQRATHWLAAHSH